MGELFTPFSQECTTEPSAFLPWLGLRAANLRMPVIRVETAYCAVAAGPQPATLRGGICGGWSRVARALARLICSPGCAARCSYSRPEPFVSEPSFRNFLRARFLAKACFTRRFSPGFK